MTATKNKPNEINILRVYDAPVKMVWDAWTTDQVGNWWGLSAPAKTDPTIIKKLAAAIQGALRQPAVIEQLAKLGTTTVGNSPTDFAAQLGREATVWRTAIEAAKIKLE